MLAKLPSWPPNYTIEYDKRAKRLSRIRASDVNGANAWDFYKLNPVSFINHWCITYDPRNAPTDIPTRMPFVMFKRQAELVEFLRALVEGQQNGLIEKCRDLGATWVACAFSVWLWLFLDGASVGWGSRKEQLVDKLGDPDSIFEKMRMIINNLPHEFLPAGFSAKDHMTYMRIINPQNGSTITGEAGDNIGRGGRKLIYFKDESAHYEHAEMIEAALTDNTRVQIDISSVSGPNTVFHRKREAGLDWEPGTKLEKGRTHVLVMDWRDHPGKTQEWYNERQKSARDNGLSHIFAQEVDRNYAAAVDGVVIMPDWVKASIDAHLILGFTDVGGWSVALDVADGGGDTNALAKRKGVVLKSVEEWGERDTGVTARRAVAGSEGIGAVDVQYDCIGVGAGVKAETNRLRDVGQMPKTINFVPWNAGDEVLDKDKHVIPGDKQSPLNGDFFHNLKAQAWWNLARRFERTYRAVRSKAPDATKEEKSFTWKADQLISLPRGLPLLRKIEKELSQATMKKSVSSMRLVIDKAPDGVKSPNCADSIVMAYWPLGAKKLNITDAIIQRARMVSRG